MFNRWFQGRYGVDQLSRALIIASLIVSVISWFFGRAPAGVYYALRGITLALIAFALFRMLSRNFYARQQELARYMNKFDEIQALLGLTDKERAQILSINMANNPSRKYKEVWIGLGGTQSAVYATEVSLEEYICYTTEETEKLELMRLTERIGGNIELAIKQLAESKRNK